ncbi:hypothetical protein ANN_06845 [Periplaneta americana]|uniref:Uncharacterized protein n=1 Tax=Periplaneta americana TaxID=6978 RepID=A0ABQ8TEL8_PERAM|nr:hypothetical protein ANN_06845 [Periplaneta americana]
MSDDRKAKQVIEMRMESRVGRERPRNTWEDRIEKVGMKHGKTEMETKRMSQDREGWMKWTKRGLQMWFMHDGAPAHFLRNMRENLTLIFQDHCIDWEAPRLDLNPLDFWLWGHMKEPGQFQRVRDSLRQTAEECIAMNGRRFEHLL